MWLACTTAESISVLHRHNLASSNPHTMRPFFVNLWKKITLYAQKHIISLDYITVGITWNTFTMHCGKRGMEVEQDQENLQRSMWTGITSTLSVFSDLVWFYPCKWFCMYLATCVSDKWPFNNTSASLLVEIKQQVENKVQKLIYFVYEGLNVTSESGVYFLFAISCWFSIQHHKSNMTVIAISNI